MASLKPLFWKLSIAVLSLLAAIAVYSFARTFPPDILAPLQTDADLPVSLTGIFGSAPSFFYTLALGLIIGLISQGQSNSQLHCLAWIGLCLALEVTQYQGLSEPLSNWLSTVLSVSTWSLVGPYWTRGTFDPADLIATLAGGICALYASRQLSVGEKNAPV